MKSNEKPRHAASNAVIALRSELGKTQQEFAVEVVKTAIGTVAVWETTRPPSGDTLLRLADVAWEHGSTSLAETFTTLFLDDLFPRLHSKKLFKVNPKASGYVVCWFDGPKDAANGAEFLSRRVQDLTEIANRVSASRKSKPERNQAK